MWDEIYRGDSKYKIYPKYAYKKALNLCKGNKRMACMLCRKVFEKKENELYNAINDFNLIRI
jgi:hypothetical protein